MYQWYEAATAEKDDNIYHELIWRRTCQGYTVATNNTSIAIPIAILLEKDTPMIRGSNLISDNPSSGQLKSSSNMPMIWGSIFLYSFFTAWAFMLARDEPIKWYRNKRSFPLTHPSLFCCLLKIPDQLIHLPQTGTAIFLFFRTALERISIKDWY